MKRGIILLIGLSLLAGCASRPKQQGSGEFYRLSTRNVVERDLTRPAGPDNLTRTIRYETFPTIR